MSLFDTESFMIYKRYNNDDTLAATKETYDKMFKATGFQTFRDGEKRPGFVVGQHPLYADRNALLWSSSITAVQQYIVRKQIAVGKGTTGALIGGFSLFVPSSFVPSTSANTYSFLMVFAAAANSGINTMVGSDDYVTNEIFRVRADLRVGYGTTNQNAKAITPGKMAYLEYRITANDLRVWLDDVLVMQKTVTFNFETIGFGIVPWGSQGGSSQMAGATGKWAIADWYNLLEDTVLPNKRCGPSTRIIGILPKTDSAVQFARPVGYTSNADVAALPLDPDAGVYLKTDVVGAKDIYAGADDSATATAAIVHAVGVKAFAQNLDTAAHNIKPLVVVGNAEGGTAVPLPASFGIVKSYATVDPSTGNAWAPAAAAASKFGMKIDS